MAGALPALDTVSAEGDQVTGIGTTAGAGTEVHDEGAPLVVTATLCRDSSSSVRPEPISTRWKLCLPNPSVCAVTVRPVPDPEGRFVPVGHLQHDGLSRHHEEGFAQLRRWLSKGVSILGRVKGQDPD